MTLFHIDNGNYGVNFLCLYDMIVMLTSVYITSLCDWYHITEEDNILEESTSVIIYHLTGLLDNFEQGHDYYLEQFL